MSSIRLKDNYGRIVDRFRVSVTQRCNHACIFCHREGIFSFEEEALSPEDYGFLAKVSKTLGISKYKLTGGEPLLRNDIADIVRELKSYSNEVSLSTNGSLLKDKASALLEAGLDRLNISLHSFRDEVFSYITRAPLKRVIEGLKEALDIGLNVKINFVVMKSNINEITNLLDFATNNNVSVNLIELIPLGTPQQVYVKEYVSLNEVEHLIEQKAVKKYFRNFQNRPIYVLDSGVEVGLIRGYGNPHLCSGCTRLRLTPSGKIKICIFREDIFVDVKEAIKSRDSRMLEEALKKATLLREPYFKYG
ncbi:MAG: GTP 3',8-cyclase MoaA [Desulfurococcaceae archaeon TW002]